MPVVRPRAVACHVSIAWCRQSIGNRLLSLPLPCSTSLIAWLFPQEEYTEAAKEGEEPVTKVSALRCAVVASNHEWGGEKDGSMPQQFDASRLAVVVSRSAVCGWVMLSVHWLAVRQSVVCWILSSEAILTLSPIIPSLSPLDPSLRPFLSDPHGAGEVLRLGAGERHKAHLGERREGEGGGRAGLLEGATSAN